MGRVLKDFVVSLKEDIERERAELQTFAARLTASNDDPLTVLSWNGVDAFRYAARIRVYTKVIVIIEAAQKGPSPYSNAEVVAAIKAGATKAILQAVKASPSTNTTANLATGAEGAARADILDMFNTYVLPEDTKS